MNAPHTLAEQLAALLAEKQALEQDLHAERVDRLLADLHAIERLLADLRAIERNQGGPRYARNLPPLEPRK